MTRMWAPISTSPDSKKTPSARSKHSATLLGGHVYLLGGRNGNLPLKDLWRYSIAENKWEVLQPSGDKPPCLQEHSAVVYKDCIYVFGGELGFSACNETPLWVYNVKSNTWRKIKVQKGTNVPKGRRGHSALVHRGSMLLYGGYRDLRGSSSELWAFHFETESWHLLAMNKDGPPARHKHSAVIHDEAMWIYGGMTDLHERGDLWRFDLVCKRWSLVKCKINPGALHSHSVCKLPSSMVIFGGEHAGQLCNELWRFHFGSETWEKVTTDGNRPQPRSECVALPVSELLLQDYNNPRTSPPAAAPPRRCRGSGTERIISFCDRDSDDDGLAPRKPPASTPTMNLNILKEITKLSQINLSRFKNQQTKNCHYSVLSSNESLNSSDSEPSRHEMSFREMVKSQSANIIARSLISPQVPQPLINFSSLSRDPCSVPNFKSLAACTLTPVEATKLVYLDDEQAPSSLVQSPKIEDFSIIHQKFQPNRLNRRSFPTSASARFGNPYVTPEESSDQTSDYASIETMNRLSFQETKRTPLSFANPNYLGPDVQTMISRRSCVKVLNSPPDSLLEDNLGRSNSRQEMVEMKPIPPRSLSLVNSHSSQMAKDRDRVQSAKKSRAYSAGRYDRETAFSIFLVGGKEQGQVTVFKRPISIWKLSLSRRIY
ncbi:unnamed protein product [Bemisia tabaci]|uniref:Uncharacterized protein n=1 Tax=Bemisia tabaci TaxID=7038 RepID=A0A9P0G1G3_BEMTA|nr:unnamed protein product [Bemisia tabaci]